ncbi:hypothetical protein ISF6_2259 [Piscinibacter sakaiensis]|uniref:Uncharacterized protein n=1 Tax=Piscinibacter sakaiensis TaxID=1547922 RepID=A0A0K8P1K5_PISS1|nr:hypothetical protein ISF6_2259 [Piscinibacter sakaiensis]
MPGGPSGDAADGAGPSGNDIPVGWRRGDPARGGLHGRHRQARDALPDSIGLDNRG